MSILTSFKAELLNHTKLLPDMHIMNNNDFHLWGQEFCEKMLSPWSSEFSLWLTHFVG
jgi:hypothetical protein